MTLYEERLPNSLSGNLAVPLIWLKMTTWQTAIEVHNILQYGYRLESTRNTRKILILEVSRQVFGLFRVVPDNVVRPSLLL
jgi:hypothetical protein